MNSRIKLGMEKRNEMLSSIQQYFANERDDELGDLAAAMVLDFFIKELAPEFYNQGVTDSYNYSKDKIEDLLGLQIYKR